MMLSRTWVLAFAAGCGGEFDFEGNDATKGEGRNPNLPIEPAPDRPITPSPISGTGPLVNPPLPIMGGTLLVTRTGDYALAGDPDRDSVSIIDLRTESVRARLRLADGAEPGRMVEDAAGLVHVVLRKAGAIAAIHVTFRRVESTRPVCAAPRGIAYDPEEDSLIVACQSGHLVTLPAGGGEPTDTRELLPDLRDVVVENGRLWVSRFRSAEILRVEEDGFTVHRIPDQNAKFTPSVAWRMVAHPDGGVEVLHQLGNRDPILVALATPGNDVNKGAYGGGPPVDRCVSASMVLGALARVDDRGAIAGPALADTLLPVDLAIGSSVGFRTHYVAAAGNAGTKSGVTAFDDTLGARCASPLFETSPEDNEVISVAIDKDGFLLKQLRDPPVVVIQRADRDGFFVEERVELEGPDMSNEGHAFFHRNAGCNLACASCHPEGGDDGRVWTFTDIGVRRTQSLRVGVGGTEPLHWDGELPKLEDLLDEVFTNRMLGPELSSQTARGFGDWIHSIEPWPVERPRDGEASQRGQILFFDTKVGCASCHAGPKLTNNLSADVGTGGRFQVPSLIGVSNRLPVLHDGCAETLADRFDPTCGGGDRHGKTSHLTAAEIADLTTYLESL
jgi:hypothetical protein